MTAARQVTDPLLSIYRQPPTRGPGVCEVCHGAASEGYRRCESCALTMSQVRRPTTNILPISLYQVNTQLWHVLRSYKDGNEVMRREFRTVVAATIARFVNRHWPCVARLAGGPPTLVTTVPSTREPPRPGEHPLVTAVKRCARLVDLYRPVLARGPGQVAHRRANDDAFEVTRPLREARVLLVEDTFTSGARTQSAASALQRAGASGLAVVVVGRVINPDYSDASRRIWDTAGERQFDFDTCCRCVLRS